MTQFIYKKDATEFLNKLGEGTVDLIITDPPYSSLEKHRKIGTTTRLSHSTQSSNDWFDVVPNEYFPAFLKASYSVLAKNSHMYVMCDWETARILCPMAEAEGFRCWDPIIWDKVTMGMGYHYRRRKEFILFFEKGKRKLNDLGIPDILTHKRVNKAYPTEKPVSLLEVLVTQSSSPGDLVVDPFCGSGSTGEAALRQSRLFVGSDTSQVAVDRAKARLEIFNVPF